VLDVLGIGRGHLTRAPKTDHKRRHGADGRTPPLDSAYSSLSTVFSLFTPPAFDGRRAFPGEKPGTG
jgi:hypothetical protein